MRSARPIPLAAEYLTPPRPTRPIEWVTVARLRGTAQWHQARAALTRSQIPSLMGGRQEDEQVADRTFGEGIVLQVPQADAERAQAIIRHSLSGGRWCPRCGSPHLRDLPLPWYWIAWSVLFLGIAPFVPPRWECRNCGKRID